MVDSIRVFDPGWRALDANGDPFTDAVISFFDAGTSDARTVYSDSDLSTSLGTEVDCNAGGEPVTSVNNPTLIYTGTTAYKLTISSAIAGYSRTFDNVLGALDTSSFLTEAAVANQSIVAVSTNYSVTAADKGKVLNVNCSGGDITITFAAAATLGDGFFVGIRHDGTANQVLITGNGSDTFGLPGINATRFALNGRGHTVWAGCDATNFKVNSECPPLIGATTGLILIADRLSTPPGSPEAGSRYIVGDTPIGAWSGFAEHDIAEANGGGGWFNYTPASDCGWIAYVQDEDRYYTFRSSAWELGLEPAATTSVAGLSNLPRRAYASYTSTATISTVIPADGTIPQNTEGTQILSVSITPSAATSRIRLTFSGAISTNTTDSMAMVAVFRDSTANAIYVMPALIGSNNDLTAVSFTIEDAPATTSAVTYAIRAGGEASTVIALNASSTITFGGATAATLVAEEIFV